MPNLNVSYDDMRAEATQLRMGQQDLTARLDQLRARITGLVQNGFQTDMASTSYDTNFYEFNEGAKKTVAALEGLAQSLEKMADTLQRTDQALAGQA